MAHLEVTEDIQDSDLAVLKTGLAQSYTARGGLPYSPRNLGIYMRDDEGKLLGGLTGETFWSWLYVAFFWVSESSRNKGLGSEILHRAEDEAIKRGCHSAYLYTQSYGAPNFYEKLGYKKFITLANCPPGHEQIGFMKRLAA